MDAEKLYPMIIAAQWNAVANLGFAEGFNLTGGPFTDVP